MFGSHYTYWFWHLYPAVLDRLLLIFVFFNNLVHCLHPIRFLIVFPQSSFPFSALCIPRCKVTYWALLLRRKRNYHLFFWYEMWYSVYLYLCSHISIIFLLLESTILFIYYLLSSLGSHYSIIFCSIISIKQFQGGWGFFSPFTFLQAHWLYF